MSPDGPAVGAADELVSYNRERPIMFLFTYIGHTSNVGHEDFWADNIWDAVTQFRLRFDGAHILSVQRFA